MNTTWVLVADARKARLFETTAADRRLKEIECLVNPASGPSRAEGPPPRVQESVGKARHVIEPRTTERDKGLDQFAMSLADHLRREHAQRHFDKLMIAAAPRFLGALHKHLDEAIKQQVTCELNLSLTTLSPEDIGRRLPPR